MIPCPHCGEMIEAWALFCPHCHLVVRQKRLSKMMTRLLSRPHRANKPPSVPLVATPPVPATPPPLPPSNGQLTQQLQGSIQHFLRQERVITIATYSIIPLTLILLTLVFTLSHLHSPTDAASVAAPALSSTPVGATFITPPTTLVPGTGAPTATASPTATVASTNPPQKTATPTAAPRPTATAAPQVVLAIDAGETGAGSGIYQSDVDFSGGKTVTTQHAIDTSLVGNLAPANVYQSARAGTSLTGISFTYTIQQLTPGAHYTVRLGFAEIDGTEAGQRQFNVAINNQAVLTDFDIVAQAGAPYKAIVESFTTTADSSGQISIVFSAGKANVALVSSVEVLTASPGA